MFACPKTVPLTMGPLKIGPSPPFFLLPHHTACASLLHFHSSINQSINSFNSFNLIHWFIDWGMEVEQKSPVPLNYTFPALLPFLFPSTTHFVLILPSHPIHISRTSSHPLTPSTSPSPTPFPSFIPLIPLPHLSPTPTLLFPFHFSHLPLLSQGR